MSPNTDLLSGSPIPGVQSLAAAKRALRRNADKTKVAGMERFFKSGPGEYGEGDAFLGVTVPLIREVAKQYRELPQDQVLQLLESRFHEERLLGVLILVQQFEHGDDVQKKEVYEFYIKNADRVNNWDLVDLSCPKIVGVYLEKRSRSVLYRFARSRNLWKRRISIISTFPFIRNRDFTDTLELAKILINDEHDLIHKAVGWMLREVGNRDLPTEERFLKQNYKAMPRTMLRSAIEKFPKAKRQRYLNTL